MTLSPWISCSGNSDSDIHISGDYQLIRQVTAFGWDRVVIIYHGVKVHELTAYEGLAKSMDWCRDHHEKTPEVDFATYAEQQR